VLAAALVLLAFCGDVCRPAHLLLSPHVRCPYDGALVHEDELPPSLLTLAARDAARAPQPVSVQPRHDHHGCDVSGAVHRFSAILVPGGGGVRRAAASPLSVQRDSRERVARSVLSYAPKLSPPV
jgi:hypothetical protein